MSDCSTNEIRKDSNKLKDSVEGLSKHEIEIIKEIPSRLQNFTNVSDKLEQRFESSRNLQKTQTDFDTLEEATKRKPEKFKSFTKDSPKLDKSKSPVCFEDRTKDSGKLEHVTELNKRSDKDPIKECNKLVNELTGNLKEIVQDSDKLEQRIQKPVKEKSGKSKDLAKHSDELEDESKSWPNLKDFTKNSERIEHEIEVINEIQNFTNVLDKLEQEFKSSMNLNKIQAHLDKFEKETDATKRKTVMLKSLSKDSYKLDKAKSPVCFEDSGKLEHAPELSKRISDETPIKKLDEIVEDSDRLEQRTEAGKEKSGKSKDLAKHSNKLKDETKLWPNLKGLDQIEHNIEVIYEIPHRLQICTNILDTSEQGFKSSTNSNKIKTDLETFEKGTETIKRKPGKLKSLIKDSCKLDKSKTPDSLEDLLTEELDKLENAVALSKGRSGELEYHVNDWNKLENEVQLSGNIEVIVKDSDKLVERTETAKSISNSMEETFTEVLPTDPKSKEPGLNLNVSRSHVGAASQESGNMYQITAALFIIASLLKNDEVEHFSVDYNHKFINIFEDVVIIVKRKDESDSHMYAIQIKSREKSPKLYLNDTPKKLEITKYKEAYEKLLNSTIPGPDIEEENIHICIFCDKDVASTLKVRRPNKTFLTFYLKRRDNKEIILPSVNDICYKYSSNMGDDNQNEHQSEQRDENESHNENGNAIGGKHKKITMEGFLDKLLLFPSQGTTADLKTEIKKKLKINEYVLKEVTNYVSWYFMNNSAGLTKQIIESELFYIYLKNFKVKPTSTVVKVNKKAARELFKIIQDVDVILVEDQHNIERILYGAIAVEIFGSIRQWNNSIRTHCGVLTDKVKLRAREFVKKENISFEIDTLDCLTDNICKYNRFPLILKTDSPIRSMLESCNCNQIKIIVIGSLQALYREYEGSKFNVWRHIGDIDKDGRDKLLKEISISLQGRKPVSLDAIAVHTSLLEKLTCNLIMNLIPRRNLFIKRECLESLKSLYNIEEEMIEEEGMANIRNETYDIKVYYKRPKLENPAEEIKSDSNFCRLIYHFQSVGDKLKLIEGDKSGLKDYFIDECNNSVYSVNEKFPIPIIGRRLESGLKPNSHTLTGFRKAVLTSSFLQIQNAAIFLITGDLEFFTKSTKQTIIDPWNDNVNEIETKLRKNDNVFIDGRNTNTEEIWMKFKTLNPQLFLVKVNNNEIQLLKYRNCKSLSSHISYSAECIAEKDFFNETEHGIVVEVHIDKLTLLRFLAKVDNYNNYILVCNLSEYKSYLKSETEDFFKDPLEFIFKSWEGVSLYNSPNKTSRDFLHELFKLYRKQGKLVLVMNDLDRVFDIFRAQLLKLIKKITETKLRIVIACNLETSYKLIDMLEMQPIQIITIKEEDPGTLEG